MSWKNFLQDNLFLGSSVIVVVKSELFVCMTTINLTATVQYYLSEELKALKFTAQYYGRG